jgi:hypothetical protein
MQGLCGAKGGVIKVLKIEFENIPLVYPLRKQFIPDQVQNNRFAAAPYPGNNLNQIRVDKRPNSLNISIPAYHIQIIQQL